MLFSNQQSLTVTIWSFSFEEGKVSQSSSEPSMVLLPGQTWTASTSDGNIFVVVSGLGVFAFGKS